MTLAERYEQVKARVEAACMRSGRRAEDINVIAVTKYVDAEMTERVLNHGLLHIGENRWQNAADKWYKLGNQGVWHFIGHLQTNKVKDVVGRFPYIHSVDRLTLAKEIQKKASELGISVNGFIQVNVSGEQSKYGLAPDALMDFAKQLRELPNLKIIGLMTMAPLESESEDTRPVFRGLRQLRDELNGQAILAEPVSHLSMGMSNDFEVAIEEGATWVRLGSVLVGH